MMNAQDEVQRAFASGYEEAVEVNQRGLIEKILARYSGEYTVFRELLQNADDAQAATVEIHFQSANASAGTSQLKSEAVNQIVVKNDGIVFREEDWRRLKTVADGQPSVESIGAFGVGFYSIWSLSDEPLVVSGEQMMLFFWKGQQLAVKRAKNPHAAGAPAPSGRPWSSITMPCRSPEPMPDPATFSRFLATALPFTSNILSMSLHFNGTELCAISKTPAPARPLAIPAHTNVKSTGRMMSLVQLETAPLQLTCRAKRITLASLESPVKKLTQAVKQSFATKFLSFATSGARQADLPPEPSSVPPQKDPEEVLTASLFLRIVTATAKLTATPAVVAEIERSTKKPPPPSCKLRVLYSSKEEAEASLPDGIGSDSVHGLFSQLTTNLKSQGKIYIGFPLFQTTGCSSAISGRFIPTVEREQIDLQAKAIADYNRELLSISGITCRIIYDSEMEDLAARWKRLSDDNLDQRKTVSECASHLMQNFTYHPSTPIAEVGRIIQHSFFASNPKYFLLISTQGILPANKVRLPAIELTFLTGLAVIPEHVANENATLLEHLQDRNLLQSVTIDDVIAQLNVKPLPIGQATSAIQWWIGLASNLQYDPRLMHRFRDALIITIPADSPQAAEQVIPMTTCRFYLNPKLIPPELPVPQNMLPYAISRAIPWQDLHRVFGIAELTLLDWVRYLTASPTLDKPDTSITLSPTFSEKILTIVAKAWPNLKLEQSKAIAAELQRYKCLPTKKGMMAPQDAYMPKVTLFEDLPVTTLVAKGGMEKFLRALGVREHVDLQMVFSRLLGAGSWDQEQVAKYLTSVADVLSNDELDKLKKTAWLTRESPTDISQMSKDPTLPGRPSRYKATSLYEPNDALRKLGLPVVAWSSSKWRSQSDEARLLYRLGLKRYPSIEDVLIMASDDAVPERRMAALNYFLEHFEAHYASSYQPTKQNLPFVPVLHDGKTTFAKPTEAFSAAGAAVMGFPILHPDYQLNASKFKLATDPPASALVAKLLTAPSGTYSDARPVFAYLSGQASRFSAADHNALSFARIVPVQDPESHIWSLAFPKSIYFRSSENQVPEAFRSLFTFVDYGPAANAFLLQVGVRNEPTTAEITQMLLADPRRFLSLAGSSERYISLLRQIATQSATFPTSLKKKMQTTPFVLAFERVRPQDGNDPKAKTKGRDDDEDEDEGLLQYRLALASDIVVVDDTTLVNDFREQIMTCPQDDLIEAFVESLGGKRISKLVTTSYTSTAIPQEASSRAASLCKLILERIILFLHERPQSGKDVRLSEDWLKKNLEVKEVSRIERQRTLVLGPTRLVRSSAASAAATLEKGSLLLRVSSGFHDVDYYEVAAALTRLILAKQKIHDTLLFMTLLQTSLRDLKRRGFNVDKIMNARKAEQEASERKQRELRAEEDRQRIASQGEEKALPPAYEPRKSSTSEEGSHMDSRNSDGLGKPTSPRSVAAAPPTAKSLFSSWRQKLRGNPLVPPPAIAAERAGMAPVDPELQKLLEWNDPGKRDAVASGSGSGPASNSQSQDITPQSNINTNVYKAVAASRPDRSGNITSQVDTKEVKESSSYCDSTPAKYLDYVTDVEGIRFYVSQSLGPEDNILQLHGRALKRYIQNVIKPVGDIYNVDPKALHVFYDTTGPLIAFNRSGSIFFNLRYHLAWHGEQANRNEFEAALISTYFSMAHELAHNLVQPHNSEHAFYTSSIAQTFFISMAAYIAQTSQGTHHPDLDAEPRQLLITDV